MMAIHYRVGSTRECLSTGLWNGTTPHCTETDGIGFVRCVTQTQKDILFTHAIDPSVGSQLNNSCGSTGVIVGVVCSLVFTVAPETTFQCACSRCTRANTSVGVSDCWSSTGSSECLPHTESEGKVFWSHLLLSPSPPPPATYEEVGVASEKSHDIQLTSNESYAPLHKDNIHTSHNTAYGLVLL